MATVAGLFDSQTNAEQAVNALDRLGVEPNSIRVLTQARMEGTGGILSSLANAFNAGDDNVSSTLIRMGFPREEAEFFSQDFDENAVLVAVEADRDQEDEVLELLRRAGGRAHGE